MTRTKRLVCARCIRPQRTCICHWCTPTAHAVEVLILQHPLEVDHAKGSARLLNLSLPNSRLLVGEAFDDHELQALLHSPFTPGAHRKHAILLYPDTPEGTGMAQPAVPADVPWAEPEKLRLVVLDATWRKSRKMLYANPPLQSLPRLALRDAPPSQYLIRKAHGMHQLSTLEATCYALMQLERDRNKYAPLLNAFNGFVAQQLSYRKADHA
ncbi:tRNA-uridine aminocarboxypropyltransferase [Noviherbaspirillum sp.]|uniref:tRNA-uridine aminocarboxypropyltransferase n=1 Tax=Noviherbaspirillum sp. TaxID=1926288 RepID=UPI002D3F6563|nr:tRNA-uridine aminocarboxypropyltransferase [Noviherbaspirillum sp.]HZW20304.1 tRNA-uridine aminocarboxypropyltransferase [Noviherbaspirillum sp.]